ncbi:MAG: hypothetical protein Q4G07_07515 [Oscillospiraceae bacterium]|nr:hypothetical protein [Oscillospiraceae bacterium]
MEIERKFEVTDFPENLPELRRCTVRQGYLATRPVTVRIRGTKEEGKEETYRLCIKGKGTLVRTEVETPLSCEQFSQLAQLLEKSFIKKEYRAYALPEGLVLECSAVDADKPLGGFLYAEVEFDSVEAANRFVPPDFLKKDLTELPGTSMSAYWERKPD